MARKIDLELLPAAQIESSIEDVLVFAFDLFARISVDCYKKEKVCRFCRESCVEDKDEECVFEHFTKPKGHSWRMAEIIHRDVSYYSQVGRWNPERIAIRDVFSSCVYCLASFQRGWDVEIGVHLSLLRQTTTMQKQSRRVLPLDDGA